MGRGGPRGWFACTRRGKVRVKVRVRVRARVMVMVGFSEFRAREVTDRGVRVRLERMT